MEWKSRRKLRFLMAMTGTWRLEFQGASHPGFDIWLSSSTAFGRWQGLCLSRGPNASMQAIKEPTRTVRQNPEARKKTTTDSSQDGPISFATGIQYFKLRKQSRGDRRPALLDPKLIRRRPPDIRPGGFRNKRQFPSVLPTTTVVVTSTTTVPPTPLPFSIGTEMIAVLSQMVSVLPPVVTTLSGSNGSPPETLTLRPGTTVTFPATTETLPEFSGATTSTTVMTVTGSNSDSGSQNPTGLPESPNGSPDAPAPLQPQSRISTDRVGVIVGSTIGSVAVLILLLILLLLLRRRRERMREGEPVLLPDPFPSQPRFPVLVSQGPPTSSSSLPLGGAAAVTAAQSDRPRQPTEQSSSKFSYTRQETFHSQTPPRSRSQDSASPAVVVAAPSSTPSPPPMSQHSTLSELQALRQRMQALETMARNAVRDADAEIANAQRGVVARASESPPEYASPTQENENGQSSG